MEKIKTTGYFLVEKGAFEGISVGDVLSAKKRSIDSDRIRGYPVIPYYGIISLMPINHKFRLGKSKIFIVGNIGTEKVYQKRKTLTDAIKVIAEYDIANDKDFVFDDKGRLLKYSKYYRNEWCDIENTWSDINDKILIEKFTFTNKDDNRKRVLINEFLYDTKGDIIEEYRKLPYPSAEKYEREYDDDGILKTMAVDMVVFDRQGCITKKWHSVTEYTDINFDAKKTCISNYIVDKDTSDKTLYSRLQYRYDDLGRCIEVVMDVLNEKTGVLNERSNVIEVDFYDDMVTSCTSNNRTKVITTTTLFKNGKL